MNKQEWHRFYSILRREARRGTSLYTFPPDFAIAWTIAIQHPARRNLLRPSFCAKLRRFSRTLYGMTPSQKTTDYYRPLSHRQSQGPPRKRRGNYEQEARGAMLSVTISTKVITWLCNELDCDPRWAEEFAQSFIGFLQASGSISTAPPNAATGGYQPTHGDLDSSNPPRGGSGVPSGIPAAAPQKPDWWPKTPYPASIFPMARERYPEIVPDPQLRTALSGMLGREFWDIASDTIWEAMLEAVEDGRLTIVADWGCTGTEYCISYDLKGPDACDGCPIGPPPKEVKMRVFKTQLEGYSGPCVVHQVESVLDELRTVLPEMAVGDSFTITVHEMDEKEYKNLPDFMGY